MTGIIAAPYPAPMAAVGVMMPQAAPAAPLPVGAVAVAQGPQGPAAAARDFGYIRYGEMMGASAIMMPAGTDTLFVVRAPRLVTDALQAPFAGFTFFDALNVLRCRKAGDSYMLSIRLSVTPQVIGGWFSMGVVIAGNVSGLAGATSSRQVDLSGPAGTAFRFDEMFQVFPSTGFAANGATLVMRSSVPVWLSSDVLFITPVVAAP